MVTMKKANIGFDLGFVKLGADFEELDRLGALVHRAMRDVLRPFLETWQADFRYWWEEKADKSIPPMERQTQYPRIGDMLAHWSEVRAIMRAIQDKLVDAYKLVNVAKLK